MLMHIAQMIWLQHTGDNLVLQLRNQDNTVEKILGHRFTQPHRRFEHVAIHQCAGGNEHGPGIKEGSLSFNALGNWATNGFFISFFADDNGSGSPDTGLEIDNFIRDCGSSAPALPSTARASSVAPGAAFIHCGRETVGSILLSMARNV